MRLVLQRVSRAAVSVDGETVGAIDRGLLVLVGVEQGDGADEASRAASKVAGLRLFADENGAMNLDAAAVDGDFLVVSNFTLAASLAKGRRPSFVGSAPPEEAEPLIESFVETLRSHGFAVPTGRFRAQMEIDLVNDGPVTFVLEI